MNRLPLFPLNLVLLPYESISLHIFEPRYKRMVKNSIEENLSFGIILTQNSTIFNKGVTVSIKEIYKEYSNGEYDILVKGEDLFNVVRTELNGDTVFAQVEYQHIDTSGIGEARFDEFQDIYMKLLLKVGVKRNLDVHLNKKISYEFLEGIQLPITFKKEILSEENELKRLNIIQNIFKNILKSKTNPNSTNMPEA